MKEAEISTALCAPEIPIKDYSGVIGVLAYFLPFCTSLHHSIFIFYHVKLSFSGPEAIAKCVKSRVFFFMNFSWYSQDDCVVIGRKQVKMKPQTVFFLFWEQIHTFNRNSIALNWNGPLFMFNLMLNELIRKEYVNLDRCAHKTWPSMAGGNEFESLKGCLQRSKKDLTDHFYIEQIRFFTAQLCYNLTSTKATNMTLRFRD